MADFAHFAPSQTQGQSRATLPPASRTQQSNTAILKILPCIRPYMEFISAHTMQFRVV